MSKSNPSSGILGGAILLTAHQYCHLLNHNTGHLRLVEGPCRINRIIALLKHEDIYGPIQEKIILNEGQYAIIVNPWENTTQTIRHGEKEIRKGPCIFALQPGEILEENQIYTEYVLGPNTGLLVKALVDFDDNHITRHAGDSWLIPGPIRYIPPKTVSILSEVKAISLGADEGIYVKNISTGAIRLDRGPKTLLLSPEEILYQKSYTPSELDALKLTVGNFDASRAFPLRLLADEVMLIVNGDQQHFEIGPKVIFLEPFDKIKVLTISGCTPKKPGVVKLWRVFVGPVFCSDELVIRTQDNAELKILVRYKIRFNLENQNYSPVYNIEDFIGFATETMASIIREEAAHHNFEELHSKASELFKQRIFTQEEGTYIFKENRLEVFGLDIKRIAPVDEQIALQLNSAIKSNMDVYVKKIQQTAELDAERALVQGKIEIEHTKKELIMLEQENARLQQITAAKIEAEANVERAQGMANSIRIQETAKNEMDLNKMMKTLENLHDAASEAYLRLEQVRSFDNIEKTVIVPSDAKVWVPFGSPTTKNAPNHSPTDLEMT